jgi:hypothetical protein
MVVTHHGIPSNCSYVFCESGNADMPMWCRRDKTAEIRSVVSDNDISAESDVPYSYLKVDEIWYLPSHVAQPLLFCSNACGVM